MFTGYGSVQHGTLQEHKPYICKKLLQYVKNLFPDKWYTCSAKN